jgi:hypothetical protein
MKLLSIIALATCIPTVIIFGLIALWFSRKQSLQQMNDDTIFFITARNSQPTARIAWSFYAASIGAGYILSLHKFYSALFAPVSFTVDAQNGAGWLGLLSYSLFSGLPIIMVAWMGDLIRKRFPKAQSLGQFSRERFGPLIEVFVTLVVLFNLSIGNLSK